MNRVYEAGMIVNVDDLEEVETNFRKFYVDLQNHKNTEEALDYFTLFSNSSYFVHSFVSKFK